MVIFFMGLIIYNRYFNLKGHFTKVYSNKGCEPQNFPGFPWDPPMGFSCKHTVCIQTNPIIEFQGNFEVHSPY